MEVMLAAVNETLLAITGKKMNLTITITTIMINNIATLMVLKLTVFVQAVGEGFFCS